MTDKKSDPKEPTYTIQNKHTGKQREVTEDEWKREGRTLHEEGWSRPVKDGNIMPIEGYVGSAGTEGNLRGA